MLFRCSQVKRERFFNANTIGDVIDQALAGYFDSALSDMVHHDNEMVDG